jgi:hypothetical protein
MRKLIFFVVVFFGGLVLLGRLAFIFTGTAYELPALVMVCVVAYFGYDKVVMGVYRWMLRKTYANESWQYFQAMKKNPGN